jgi:TonB family protein
MRCAHLLFPVSLIATSLVAQPPSIVRFPEPESSNAVPWYPNSLHSSGVSGTVRLTFMLNDRGRPDLSTVVVHSSTHEAFSGAVMQALRRWRYTPALRADSSVFPDSIEQVVEFVLSSPELIELFPVRVLERTQPGPGRWRMVIGVGEGTGKLTPVAESLHLAMSAAALGTVLSALPSDSTAPARIVCVRLGNADAPLQPTLALLRALSSRTIAAVAFRRCPPTYRSMIAVTEGEPDPPGEDPWHLRPFPPRWINDSSALIEVEMSRGTVSDTHRCIVQRDSLRLLGWRARCVLWQTRLS